VPIASSKHAAIIGQKGQTLSKIQELTNCKITVPKKESGHQYVIVEAHDAVSLRQAKKTVLEMSEKGFSELTHPGRFSLELKIARQKHGTIIGPRGSTLAKIEEKTGAEIDVPKADANSDVVTIVGEGDAVHKAKTAIEQLVEFGFSDLTHEGWARLTIGVPFEYLGAIIGPKGKTINQLQKDTKTRINVPSTRDSEDVMVTIIGDADAVENAKEQLNALMVPKEVPKPTAEWGGHHPGVDMAALHTSWDDE